MLNAYNKVLGGGLAPSRHSSIVWTPLNDEKCSVKSIYSMMRIIKIIYFLYEIEIVKNGLGSRLERRREKERNGLTE